MLIRFGIANGIFAILLGSKWNPLVFIVLLGTALVVPSIGWYAWSQMPPGEDRHRLNRYRLQFVPCIIRFIATVVTVIAATAVMEKSLSSGFRVRHTRSVSDAVPVDFSAWSRV